MNFSWFIRSPIRLLCSNIIYYLFFCQFIQKKNIKDIWTNENVSQSSEVNKYIFGYNWHEKLIEYLIEWIFNLCPYVVKPDGCLIRLTVLSQPIECIAVCFQTLNYYASCHSNILIKLYYYTLCEFMRDERDYTRHCRVDYIFSNRQHYRK